MGRDNRRIVVVKEGGSSVLWFLVGGALGAGIALLFAPDSGARTRRAVGRKLGKLRDAADDAIGNLRDALSGDETEALPEGEEDEVDDEVEDVEEVVERPEPVRRRPLSARRELEQRLAQARARRHRELADEDEEPVA